MTDPDSKIVFLTIAIPTYNNAETLARTLESCLGQTDLRDCEVLVVDNASTDSTADVIAHYASHPEVRVIRNENTVLMYDNHNICLQNARGSYILFCHSDDALDGEAVAILKMHLKSKNYPKRYICWGHSLFRDYSDMLSLHGYRTGELFAGEKSPAPFLVAGVTPSGTCYSRDVIDYGGFIKSTHRLARSDSSTMVYLALKGFRFEMLQQFIFFRTDASTAVRTVSISEKLDAYCDTYDHLREHLDENALTNLLKVGRYPPLSFCYFMASSHPGIVLKELFKWALKKPCILRNKVYRKILRKAVTSLWRAQQ